MFDRIVVAVEIIAESLSRIASSLAAAPTVPASKGVDLNMVPPVDDGPKMANPYPSVAAAPDYDSMDYDVLKKICEGRGIEVPPRTKTPTLIKKLRTADEAKRVNNAVGVVVEQLSPPPVPTPAPPPAPEPEVEADPFAEAAAAPAAEASREDALAALQDVKKKGDALVSGKGNLMVREILQGIGVAQFKDLTTKAQFGRVLKAAKEVLK